MFPFTTVRSAGALVIAAALIVAPGGVASAAPPTPQPSTPAAATALVYELFDPEVGSASLMVGDSRGLRAKPLTVAPAGSFDSHPVRSPDGRRVVFMREADDGVSIAVVAVADPGSFSVIDTGCAATPDCAADINPAWTLDGRRIMFTRVMGPFDEFGGAASAVLYSTRLDGRDLRRVSSPDTPAQMEDTAARFTPDGKYIVFIRDGWVDGALRFAIFRMRPDATAVTQLTPWDLNADRPVPSPARVGPTAGLLAFETYGGAEPGRGDIALLPWTCSSVDDCTTKTRYVTHNDGGPKSTFAATWSPSGLFLAYAEETGAGGVDVWTSRWDGRNRRQVTEGVVAYSPSWAT